MNQTNGSLCCAAALRAPPACWEAAPRGMGGDGLALPLSLMEIYEMPLGMGLSA